MKINLKVLSISFKNSPIEARELIALDDNSTKNLLEKISQLSSIKEAMVLSTCNRTEIYYVSEQDETPLLIKLIGLVKGNDLAKYSRHFNIINTSKKAVNYLFRVAAGLESQVLGDFQIPHQVKKAYQISVDNNFAGPLIHRLLHTVFFTNKRITQETTFRNGAASVSYTASQLVRKLTKNISRPKVLVIGLGAIGKDVSMNLLKHSNLDIYICNRTDSKSAKLAFNTHLKPIYFEEVFEKMKEMDVVISSVGGDQAFIKKSHLKENSVTHLSFIDLSMPRSVAPEVLEVAEVINIDELKSRVDAVLSERQSEIPKVASIIEESVSTLSAWSKEMLAAPTINKMKGVLEQIRKEELARFIKRGDPEAYKIAEKITKGMVQKIVKLPVLKLKAACKRGEAALLIETLNDLFDLEKKHAIKP